MTLRRLANWRWTVLVRFFVGRWSDSLLAHWWWNIFYWLFVRRRNHFFFLLVDEWLPFVDFLFTGRFAFVLFDDRSRLSLLVDNGLTIVLSFFDVGASFEEFSTSSSTSSSGSSVIDTLISSTATCTRSHHGRRPLNLHFLILKQIRHSDQTHNRYHGRLLLRWLLSLRPCWFVYVETWTNSSIIGKLSENLWYKNHSIYFTFFRLTYRYDLPANDLLSLVLWLSISNRWSNRQFGLFHKLCYAFQISVWS